MSSIGPRLRELRKKRNATAQEVAESVGVQRRVYVHYESETRRPSYEVLLALADFFDVSIDYLVGRSGNPERR